MLRLATWLAPVLQIGRSWNVCVQVPVGVAVEQPGGDYAYGAPASPQRAHGAYVPPSHPAAAAGHSPRRNDGAAQF